MHAFLLHMSDDIEERERERERERRASIDHELTTSSTSPNRVFDYDGKKNARLRR